LTEERVTIECGEIELEGMYHAGAGPLSAVVLHPHPQYGGDMENHVVTGICQTLGDAGAATLRFNFRGTGGSTGSHDGGRGEQDDVRAALAFVRERAPGAKVLLAGYSFGAMVAASVAAEAGLAGLILVSPPLGFADLPGLPAGLPALVAAGDTDAVSPAVKVEGLANTDVQVFIAEGVDHGWWPGLDALQRKIRGSELLAAL